MISSLTCVNVMVWGDLLTRSLISDGWADLCECDGLVRFVDNKFVCVCLQGSNESR